MEWTFRYKPSILGYPHLWNSPNGFVHVLACPIFRGTQIVNKAPVQLHHIIFLGTLNIMYKA